MTSSSSPTATPRASLSMASQSESVTKADHPTSTKMEPSVNDHGDQSGHVAFDEPITEVRLANFESIYFLA